MKFFKITLLITGLLASLNLCFAGNGKFDKMLYRKEADKAFSEGNIYRAADLYQEILAHDSTDKTVLYSLAQSYFLARDYEEGALYFQKAAKDAVNNPTALYYAGICTKMQGMYKEAIPMFKDFAKSYQGTDAIKMKKWAHTEIDGCNFALRESKSDPSIKLIHLGREVNSSYADDAPALREDVLYFSSIHSDTVLWERKDRSDSTKEGLLVKLFTSKKTGDTYTPAEQLKTFDQKGKHISNGSFNDDGTKFFYTICNPALLKPSCKIYESQLQGTEWGEGEVLGPEINTVGSSNTQPYLGKSGGIDVLYFVSDRDGGKGGTDIWYSTMGKKGEWSAPKNAGPKINTDRNETTPFLDSKTGTLYFSSDGWISMGGIDIFKIESDAPGKFSGTAENLGPPFNSPCDDFGYKFGKNSSDGYLVSNRPGIFSVRGKTCCDDIFEFKYEKQIYLAVKGMVYDDVTRQPIVGAAVNLSLRSDNNTESDVVINSDTSKFGAPYFFNLKAQQLYKVTGIKDGYFTDSRNFSTMGAVRNDTMTVDIFLKKLEKDKAYRLNNIYYDYDKWDLRPESKATLDTLYSILTENPTIIIELSSHTDSRGAEDYNLNLSQKRAESCVNYLINDKGIPKERIIAKGYGKSKPLEDCSKYPDCPQGQNGDCPCHQLNRRTEFKIVGELEHKLNENE
jgi:OOP family OmpA-OmpF porin